MGLNLKKLFDWRIRLKTLFKINHLNFCLKASGNLKVEAWTILKVKMQKMYNTCDYVNISDDVRSQERNIKITHKIL